MPIELPNLDDRTYRDLVEEALSMIPSHAPEWTNYNPSDPGITLIELFAYLSEMLIYRLNRVTDDNIRTFLSLLNGPEWKSNADLELREELRRSVLQLRARYRAVTKEDYEWLSTEGFNKWLGQMREAEANNDSSKLQEWWTLSKLDRDQESNRPSRIKSIQRAHCVVERNLEMNREEDRRKTAAGHISMVVLPSNDEIAPDELGPQPTEIQRQVLFNYLDERRILTTRLHVVGPTYAPVSVEILIARYPDVLDDVLRRRIIKAISAFLNPRSWAFGRDVYVSEFHELLEKLDGVDYLPEIQLTSQCDQNKHCVESAPTWNDEGDQVGLQLYDHHLPISRLRLLSLGIEVQSELPTEPNRTIPISDKLREEFNKSNILLAQNASISMIEKGNWWKIIDNQTIYLISQEHNRLDVYDPNAVNKIVIVANTNVRVVSLAITVTPVSNTNISNLKQRIKSRVREFFQTLRRQPDPSNANPSRISQVTTPGGIQQIRQTRLQIISQNPIQYRELDSQTLDLRTIVGVQQVNSIDLPPVDIIVAVGEVIDLRLQVHIKGE
jgi:hypothetical protein